MHPIVVTLLLCVGAAQASKLYLGCWADAPDLKAFSDDYKYILSYGENYRTCADYCRAYGYEFAGVQQGKECRCANGNMWTMYGKRKDKHCDDKCPDGSPRCGGNFKNAVYSTDLYYVGCVKDDDHYDRIFSKKLYTYYNYITPLQCVTDCTDQGFAWAGIENGCECWCGKASDTDNITDVSNDATEDECNVPCSGYTSGDSCGGVERMSVYHVLEF